MFIGAGNFAGCIDVPSSFAVHPAGLVARLTDQDSNRGCVDKSRDVEVSHDDTYRPRFQGSSSFSLSSPSKNACE